MLKMLKSQILKCEPYILTYGKILCISDLYILKKRNQSITGRTDAEAPKHWPLGSKCWLIGKDPDAGKDWRQENGMTEDKMVGWHHQLNGHEFEHTPGDSEGQGSLACCSPWGCRVEHDLANEQQPTRLPSSQLQMPNASSDPHLCFWLTGYWLKLPTITSALICYSNHRTQRNILLLPLLVYYYERI